MNIYLGDYRINIQKHILHFSLYREPQMINLQQYKQNTATYQDTSTNGIFPKMKG